MLPVYFACLYGTLSIVLGAFVQHALKDVLPQESLQTIQTAARYLFYTAIPILLICFTNKTWCWPRWLPWGFVIFGGLFGFSLVLLVGTGIRFFGYLTPIGGLGLISLWGLWGIQIYKKSKD